jgi:hypothetical protein
MITLIALVFAASYALWILFMAVMNLKRVRDMGKLGTLSKVFGYPVLVVGYALDVLVNVTLMTVLFLEIPRETTVTARLKRHNRTGSGWRQRLAAWFEPLIDPYDPSGDHI